MRPVKGSTNLRPTLNKVQRREELLAPAKNFSAPRKARDKPGCRMDEQNLNWLSRATMGWTNPRAWTVLARLRGPGEGKGLAQGDVAT